MASMPFRRLLNRLAFALLCLHLPSLNNFAVVSPAAKAEPKQQPKVGQQAYFKIMWALKDLHFE